MILFSFEEISQKNGFIVLHSPVGSSIHHQTLFFYPWVEMRFFFVSTDNLYSFSWVWGKPRCTLNRDDLILDEDIEDFHKLREANVPL